MFVFTATAAGNVLSYLALAELTLSVNTAPYSATTGEFRRANPVAPKSIQPGDPGGF